LPGDYWAVQLIALNSQAELQDFMQSTQLDELTGAMINVNGRTWYVALLGVFENRDLAERAAAQRPAALQRYEPYIRSVASLQAAMIAADTL
jgi:septal ring-binding cell division protein DamX